MKDAPIRSFGGSFQDIAPFMLCALRSEYVGCLPSSSLNKSASSSFASSVLNGNLKKALDWLDDSEEELRMMDLLIDDLCSSSSLPTALSRSLQDLIERGLDSSSKNSISILDFLLYLSIEEAGSLKFER